MIDTVTLPCPRAVLMMAPSGLEIMTADRSTSTPVMRMGYLPSELLGSRLLTTTTAIAPASRAACTLLEKVQTPRSMRAMFPAISLVLRIGLQASGGLA